MISFVVPAVSLSSGSWVEDAQCMQPDWGISQALQTDLSAARSRLDGLPARVNRSLPYTGAFCASFWSKSQWHGHTVWLIP